MEKELNGAFRAKKKIVRKNSLYRINSRLDTAEKTISLEFVTVENILKPEIKNWKR